MPSSRRREDLIAWVKSDATEFRKSGYTHYMLTIDGSENTAYLVQLVEGVGWRLEHAGWVWAEKGYMGYGGFGVLNAGMVGNFLFRRASKSSAALPVADEASGSVPTRADV